MFFLANISALFNEQNDKDGQKQSEILLSYVAQNFELAPSTLIGMISRVSPKPIAPYFSRVMSSKQLRPLSRQRIILTSIGLTPITCAILFQSIHDLDREISLDPEAVEERI